MNEFVYKLTLDLNCSKTPPVICSGQFDKGRKFEFSITANGEPYDVTGCSAVLKGVRSDGSHFAVECAVSNGKIIKTLDDTTLSVRGMTVAKLVISDSGKSYSTQKFLIDVDSALEGDITVADDYSILNRLIEQIHALNESGAILVDNTINESSNNAVANKAVATALAAKEDSNNKISDITKVTDEDANYPSIAFLLGYYYDYQEIEELMSRKLDNAAGAVATDNIASKAVTTAKLADEVQNKINSKTDKATATILFNADKIPIKTSTATTLSSGGFATSKKNLVTAFISKNVTSIQGGTFSGCTNLTDVYIDNTADSITIDSGAIPSTATIHYNDDFNFVDYLTNALTVANNAIANKLDNAASTVANTNIADGAVTTDKLADEVKTTINGKLDNTAGSVETDNIADKAVTNDKIANGAITNFKIANGAVSGSNIAQNQIGTIHLQDGAVTTVKLADEVKTSINSKYDSSNIEEGTADLTPYSASEIAIKSAKCLYTKIGKRIICNIKITMGEFSMKYNSSIHLIDLPFVTSLPDKLFFVAVTNKQDYLRASLLVSSSWVSILNNTGNTINFAEDDTIDCTVLYNTK